MIGGILVNVSGPCLRGGDVVKVVFDEYAVDCVRVNNYFKTIFKFQSI